MRGDKGVFENIQERRKTIFKKSNIREDSVLNAGIWLAATLSSLCLTNSVKQTEDKVAANQNVAMQQAANQNLACSTLSSLMFDFL